MLEILSASQQERELLSFADHPKNNYTQRTPVHGARPFIYKVLHRALASVAVKSINN